MNLKFTSTGKSAKFSQIVQKHLQVQQPFPADKPIYVARHHWHWRQLQRFDAGKRPSTTASKAEIQQLSGVVDEEASWEPSQRKEYFMAPNVPKEAVAYAIDCIVAATEQKLVQQEQLASPMTCNDKARKAELQTTRDGTIQPSSMEDIGNDEEREKLSEENRQLREEIDRLTERLKNQELLSDTDLQNFIAETFAGTNVTTNCKDTCSHLGTVGSTAVDDFVFKDDSAATLLTASPASSCASGAPLKRQKTASSIVVDLSCTLPVSPSTSSLSDESLPSAVHLSDIIPADLKPEEAAIMETLNIANLDLENDLLPFGTGAA
jgi:hypothetical protein